MLNTFCLRHLLALSYLEKVTEAFSLILSGSKMADQNVGLGSFSPLPPLAIQGLSLLDALYVVHFRYGVVENVCLNVIHDNAVFHMCPMLTELVAVSRLRVAPFIRRINCR